MSRNRLDTQECKVGQGQCFELPASGPVGELIDEVKSIDTPNFKSKAKLLAFMEEPVKILIKNTGMPEESQFVEVGNNGTVQFIERGKWQTVKRKFVEVLARAKKYAVQTQKYKDQDGADSTKIVTIPALVHNFETQDSPDGKVWLNRILAEAE